MVLSGANNTVFFETEMGIPTATVTQLGTLGITRAEDLIDYDEDLLNNLKEDLRKPTGTMQDPNDPARVVPQAPFILTPVSCRKLLVAAKAIEYYEAVGRATTIASLRWAGPLTRFSQYLKALKVMKNEEKKEPPKVTRSLPIGQWSEAFLIYLENTLGVRDIPLAYVVRSQATPPAPAPALRTGYPYSTEHGSVSRELIERASHTHVLFDTDNEEVFNHLESSLRSTQYAATLSSFKRAKDGRGAWTAVISQYVGRDKWQKEVKKQEVFLHTFVWKGNSNMHLETFVNKHRTAYVRIQQCAEHITYTIPSEDQRVQYLLNGIQSNDPQLLAAIGNVKANDGPTGKLRNFEDCAAYIIPFDPVTSKRGTKRKAPHEIAAMDLGPSKGETGVEVRFYSPKDYRKLTNEQKMELKRIRAQNRSKKSKVKEDKEKGKVDDSKKSDKDKVIDRMIAAFELQEKQVEKVEADQKVKDMVVSAIQEIAADAQKNDEPSKKASGKTGTGVKALQGILKRT